MSPVSRAPGLTRRAALLAFAVAFVTLFTQVLVHRLVTAKLVNNFAFLVISLTMLGFALSGVVLTRWLEVVLRRLSDAVALSAALFTGSLIASAAAFCRAPAKAWAESRAGFVWDFVALMPLSLAFALPFAFCGLVLGALLASPTLETRRIYFADLLGSAAGAFTVLLAVSALGVEASLLAGCALLLAASFLLGAPASRFVRGAVAAAALLVAVAAAFPERVFAIRYPEGTILRDAERPGSGLVLEHVAWDPVARIEVSRVNPPDPGSFPFPSLVGSDRAFLARFRRLLTQNNNAFTYAVDYDGRAESLHGIEDTIYAAAYQASAVPRPRVLVIGVGGGFDVLCALRFSASQVTGVEVNGATMRILTSTYRDYFRSWAEDPRVRLVEAEGRHFLASSAERFDVIQLSGVDSASGTPGAAHVFSENYLYTQEAFDLYLERLEDQGVLAVMRPEYAPPREMLRALVTLLSSLRRAGVGRPSDHVVVVSATNANIVSMLVKRKPFAAEELQRIQAWASGGRAFRVSAQPSFAGTPANEYALVLSLGSQEREDAFVSLYPFDVSPTTDDRPFFFKYSSWGHLFSNHPVIARSIPLLELSLLLLVALTGAAALVCVYLPLRYLSRHGETSRGAWRYGVYFASIGVGYLAIEVALLQKFGLYLGHPNYALSVVLAALLLFTGTGALACEAVMRVFREIRFVSYALCGLILAEYFLALPLLPRLGGPFWLRCLVVFALVAPLGVLLGVFLPSALERLKRENASYIPWAWGINGIFSVVAPVVSVAVSMTFGISVLLVSAPLFYLLAGAVLAPGASAQRPLDAARES